MTLVLWAGCMTVGLLGFTLSYAAPRPLPAKPKPMEAELLKVELTRDPLPPDFNPPSPAAAPVPAQPETVARPQVPQAIPVAEPATVAFALPVEGPTRVVESSQAAFSREAAPAHAVSATPAQTLTFGRGEGRQPAPEYPARARRDGQEGTVSVRLTVGESGRVLAVEAAPPSRWALLNEAALRAVRERWRFPAGKLRVYEVAIRFELNR